MKGLKGIRKPCIRALTVMLMVIVALTLVAQPALAKQPGNNIEREYTRAITTLERYLSISETGNIVLNAPKRVVKSIDSEVYQSLLAGLEQTNSMIDSGYLVANPDFTLTVTEKYLESSSQLRAEGNAVYLVEGIQTLSSSGGVNKAEIYWWGFKIWLNDYYCRRVVAGLSITSLLCALLGSVAGKILAGVLGIYAALIGATNEGNGVIMRFHWIPQPIPVPMPPMIILTGIWPQ